MKPRLIYGRSDTINENTKLHPNWQNADHWLTQRCQPCLYSAIIPVWSKSLSHSTPKLHHGLYIAPLVLKWYFVSTNKWVIRPPMSSLLQKLCCFDLYNIQPWPLSHRITSYQELKIQGWYYKSYPIPLISQIIFIF